jgi:23S rRNA pseudouridine1911/1915/1917 synthase
MQKNSKKPAVAKPNRVFEVTEETTLMVFLLEKLKPKSRQYIKTVLQNGQILVNGESTTQFNTPLVAGHKVELTAERPVKIPTYRGLRIIFEDEYLVVVDKQEGILSIATEKQKLNTIYSTLSTHIKKEDPSNRIFVVHRLDRETSGLMMFAKSEKVQELLQKDWNETILERSYLAVTEGRVEKPEGTIVSYLAENKALMVYSTKDTLLGKQAITHYKTLQSTGKHSLLQVNLETGRKNQIRVHMADIGHPLVGDAKYGAKKDPIGRLGLHAWVLNFVHPMTGENMHFETPIPGRFRGLF